MIKKLFIIIYLIGFAFISFAKTESLEKCKSVFTENEEPFTNLDSLAKAMTENLILRKDQRGLFELYLNNYFGEKPPLGNTFDDVIAILERHPELTKLPLREQLLTFEKRTHEAPESLTQFVTRFKTSSGKVKNSLFQIAANIGFWKKMLSSPKTQGGLINHKERTASKKREQTQFLGYLQTIITEEQMRYIANSSIDYTERTLFLYKILNQIREQRLKNGQDVQKLSQAMLDLVHISGFENSHYKNLLKSRNAKEQLEGIYKILDYRDQVAIKLGFENHFSELQDYLQIDYPTGFTKNENVYHTLKAIEKDIEISIYNTAETHTLRLRRLSLQESPFRSCIGGSDCSSNTYFSKALDPNFLYFTLTDIEHRSSSHITVVLGEAKDEKGQNIKIAFVDKVQNVPNGRLASMFEGIRLSLKEQGYKLGLPEDVGDHDGLSNNQTTRDYIHKEVNPQLTKTFKEFKPHKNKYFFANGQSRSYEKPNLLEFEWLGDIDVQIQPGEIKSSKKSHKNLKARDVYNQILSWQFSEKEEKQIQFIKQLITLTEIKELDFSYKNVTDYLKSRIGDKNYSFPLRKISFFTLMEFYECHEEMPQILKIQNFLNLLAIFSKEEQIILLGEINNWINGNNRNRKKFIQNLLVNKSAKEIISVLKSKNLSKITDIYIEDRDDYGNTALIQAAMKGHTKSVKLLIDEKVDLNAKNINKETALMEAARWGHKEVVQLLITAGADIYAQDIFGWNALMEAAMEGHTKSVKLLIHAKADLNAKNINKETALMVAARWGHRKVLQLLFTAGADPNIRNRDEETALIVAVKYGQEKTVQLLLKEGVNIKAKDNKGNTALIYAKIAGYPKMVELLTDAEAKLNTTKQK